MTDTTNSAVSAKFCGTTAPPVSTCGDSVVKTHRMSLTFQIQLHYGDIDKTIKSTEKRIEKYSECEGKNNLSVIRRVYQLNNLKKELIKHIP